MQSRARLLGHAIHPMLIVFPFGLLSTSLLFDVIALATGAARWAEVAYWMISAGLIGGVLAALSGVIDLVHIPSGTRARYIGSWHGAANVGVLILFLVSWLLRNLGTGAPAVAPAVLSSIGLGLLVIAAWLGGELVEQLGIGIAEGAGPNAPSSLRQRSRGRSSAAATADPAR